MDTSFMDVLKSVRESKGWTQEDLAKSIGVSQQAVQKWEAGKSLPRPARREALLSALNLDARRAEVRLRHEIVDREPRERLDRPRPPAHTLVISRDTRTNAFLAEVEELLPKECQYIVPPQPLARRAQFSPDYASPTACVKFIVDGAASNTNFLPPSARHLALQYLWGLVTLRQMELQLVSNHSRIPVLCVVTSEIDRRRVEFSTMEQDAAYHSAFIEYVENAAGAVQVLLDYETGARPKLVPTLFD